MIATKDSFEPQNRDQLPKSTRVYVAGLTHPDLRVPMREIELNPTKGFNGQVEANEPVCVYDCSGPWGDPAFEGDVEQGLPPLRRPWILARGDVEEVDLSYKSSAAKNGNGHAAHQFATSTAKALRAKTGRIVTQ